MQVKLNDINNLVYDEEKDYVRDYKIKFEGDIAASTWKNKKERIWIRKQDQSTLNM